MLGIIYLLVHVIIYAGFGMLFYRMHTRLSFIPFFLYMGILQVLISLMSSFYSLNIWGDLFIGGGSIVYAAVLWLIMFFYLMERDLSTIKMLIIGIVAIQFVFLFLYPYFAFLLNSTVINNPTGASGRIFEIGFGVFWVGNILALAEAILMIYSLEVAKTHFHRVPLVFAAFLIYIAVLLLDGVLFPLFAFPVTQAITIIQGLSSLEGKLVLGISYGAVFITTVVLGQDRFKETRDMPRLVDMITLPKSEVIEALRRAQENQTMNKILLDLLAHDIRNYINNTQAIIEYILMMNKGLERSIVKQLKQIQDIHLQSADLLTNILLFGRLQGESVQLESIDLQETFMSAYKRVENNFLNVPIQFRDLGIESGLRVIAHSILDEVFYNILSNMVKYRKDDKPVEIEAFTRRDNGRVLLIVRDRGKGIEPAQRERIFESPMIRPRHKNLGLYIAKALMDTFGGSIRIENRSDAEQDYTAGTEFHLSFREALE